MILRLLRDQLLYQMNEKSATQVVLCTINIILYIFSSHTMETFQNYFELNYEHSNA